MKMMNATEFLLKFLGRFLKTDVRYLASGGFWLALGKGVNMVIVLLISVLYAKFLPKETYGDYRYVLSIFGFLGIFALNGMGTAMRRSVARGFEKVFLKSSLFIFLSYFVVSFVGIGIGIFFFTKGNSGLASAFIIGAAIVPFSEGLGTWRGYFESKRQFRTQTVFNIGSHFFYGISMIAAVASIYFFHLSSFTSLLLLVGMYFGAQALPNALFFLKAIRMVPAHATLEPGAVRYGVHLSVIDIPATAAHYIDSIILYHFFGPVTLAVYSFAIAPLEQIKAFLGTVLTTTFPKLSVKTKDFTNLENLKKTLPGKALKASLISAAVVLAYVAIAPYFFQFLFFRYMESVRFSQLFAFSLIFFPFSIFNAVLKTEGNLKKIYVYQIIDPLIQIALLLALIPPFGLWGAIVGRIIGRYVNYFLPFLFFVVI